MIEIPKYIPQLITYHGRQNSLEWFWINLTKTLKIVCIQA